MALDTVEELSSIKERQQQTWATGDFAMIAATNVIVGEMLCEAVDLRAGQKVLDVATGSGNTAIAAARRWCDATGIDYVSSLLERARLRAAAERLPLNFREGDTEAIPFPDASFDVVLSTFGAMFAPNQQQAAQELLRVCRSGGKIGMANWTPDGFVGEWFRTASSYVPPPPGLNPPTLWGTEAHLRELFGDHLASLRTNRRGFTFRYRSADHWLDFFRRHFGTLIRTFEMLNPADQNRLANDLKALVNRFNQSGDSTVVVPADYLEVVAVKR